MAAEAQPRLILFSGLPGCGKTTLAYQLARHLQVPLFAKDRIQRVLRDQIEGSEPIHGYYLLLDLADEQLALGVSVILDAVFPKTGFRERARQMAAQHHASFRPIHCVCSDTALWQHRVATRVQLVPGWTPVGWDKVEEASIEFEPWHLPHILRLDAVNQLDENMKQALTYIG